MVLKNYFLKRIQKIYINDHNKYTIINFYIFERLLMNKIITFTILFFFKSFFINADEQIKPNFFTQFEPEAFKESYTTITTKMATFQKNSGFDAKIFNLFALSAAAGMKCEYCIIAHTYEAKKAGATEEEIKIAVMIAGVVSLNSTVLYGNQYSQDKLKKMLE